MCFHSLGECTGDSLVTFCPRSCDPLLQRSKRPRVCQRYVAAQTGAGPPRGQTADLKTVTHAHKTSRIAKTTGTSRIATANRYGSPHEIQGSLYNSPTRSPSAWYFCGISFPYPFQAGPEKSLAGGQPQRVPHQPNEAQDIRGARRNGRLLIILFLRNLQVGHRDSSSTKSERIACACFTSGLHMCRGAYVCHAGRLGYNPGPPVQSKTGAQESNRVPNVCLCPGFVLNRKSRTIAQMTPMTHISSASWTTRAAAAIKLSSPSHVVGVLAARARACFRLSLR